MQIKSDYLDFIVNTIKKYIPNSKIYFFGSRVAGNASQYSDLDVAVSQNEPIKLSILSEIKEIFAESDIPFKIDLIDFNKVDQEFQKIIESHAKCED